MVQRNGGNGEHEEESTTMDSSSQQDLRMEKRMKYLVYFAAFAVSQTAIILLFALTIVKVRTPNFRVRSVTVERFFVGTNPENPTFSLRMNAEVRVKNDNFGDYEFGKSTIYFFYSEFTVGMAVIPESVAGIRATKKFNVTVDLFANNPQLANDLRSGLIKLKCRSKLSGKVELLKVLKKKKPTDLDCALTIKVVVDSAMGETSCK